jgi:hypothetical protein
MRLYFGESDRHAEPWAVRAEGRKWSGERKGNRCRYVGKKNQITSNHVTMSLLVDNYIIFGYCLFWLCIDRWLFFFFISTPRPNGGSNMTSVYRTSEVRDLASFSNRRGKTPAAYSYLQNSSDPRPHTDYSSRHNIPSAPSSIDAHYRGA